MCPRGDLVARVRPIRSSEPRPNSAHAQIEQEKKPITTSPSSSKATQERVSLDLNPFSGLPSLLQSLSQIASISFLTGAIRQAAAGTGVRAAMLGRASAPVSWQQGEETRGGGGASTVASCGCLY